VLVCIALFVEANGVRVLVRQMKVSQGNALGMSFFPILLSLSVLLALLACFVGVGN
jgi:hypothetical protein